MSDQRSEDLEAMMIAAATPHVARAMRKVNGYPTGELTCSYCGGPGASKNRQRTAYCDDERNWATLCPRCQEEADTHWDEMWDEYYSGVL